MCALGLLQPIGKKCVGAGGADWSMAGVRVPRVAGSCGVTLGSCSSLCTIAPRKRHCHYHPHLKE